jgi:ATP-dependent exoDNAse (exonuclease V) alpha subunit
VLAEQAGIRSETLAKFLLDASKGRVRLQPGEVIVCDEASTVSARDLAQLVLHAQAAHAKLVLIGDHYQLGSVDAGALFRLVATDANTAALTVMVAAEDVVNRVTEIRGERPDAFTWIRDIRSLQRAE